MDAILAALLAADAAAVKKVERAKQQQQILADTLATEQLAADTRVSADIADKQAAANHAAALVLADRTAALTQRCEQDIAAMRAAFAANGGEWARGLALRCIALRVD